MSSNISSTNRSHLSIREVLDLLVEDFPEVTISKIRFLESRGLIHPERTPSGYRKFYETDVERLRWILRQQREHFLPLKVIKGRLEQELGIAPARPRTPSLFEANGGAERTVEHGLVGAVAMTAVANGHSRAQGSADKSEVSFGDRRPEDKPAERPEIGPGDPPEPSSGRGVEPAPVTPEPTPDATMAPSAASMLGTGASLSAEELARTAAIDLELVAQLEEYGLIAGRQIAGVHCFDEDALLVARLAGHFGRFGIEPRHLRSFRHTAERETQLYSQVVAPLLRQRNPDARQRALAELNQLAELGSSLQAAFVQAELKNLTGG